MMTTYTQTPARNIVAAILGLMAVALILAIHAFGQSRHHYVIEIKDMHSRYRQDLRAAPRIDFDANGRATGISCDAGFAYCAVLIEVQ